MVVTTTGAHVPKVRYNPRRVRDTVVRTRTLGLFDEWARSADRVVQVRLLHERIWILTDPTLCRMALTAPPDQVKRSSRYQRLIAIVGRSLLTTDGLEHRKRRRVIQPAFQPQLLAAYAPAIVEAAQDTGRAWRAGAVVSMEKEMAALTLAAIGKAVLGVDGREHAARVGRALDSLQRAIALMLVPGADRLLRSSLPAPGIAKLRRSVEQLRSVADQATTSDAPLVLSLRAASNGEVGLSPTDLRDELLTLLLAGHETTALTLTWAWWFLDKHPEVATRVVDEHLEVLGDRAPSYDDVPALHLTAAVVAETLRLRPPAWIIEREVAGTPDLDGLRPPRRTVLAVSPWLLHRDPQSWRDPDSFTPDRWLRDGRYDEAAPGHPRGAWMPFGAGSHVCVGASFAWTEAILALATLARQWRPRSELTTMPIRATATLRPAKPMLMRLHLAARRADLVN